MQEKVKGKGFEVVCHITDVPSADLSNLGEQGTCFEKYCSHFYGAPQCKAECQLIIFVVRS